MSMVLAPQWERANPPHLGGQVGSLGQRLPPSVDAGDGAAVSTRPIPSRYRTSMTITAPLLEKPELPRPQRGSDFAPLLAELKTAGLLERRTAWYTRMIGLNLVFLLASWAAVWWLGNSWWQLALAVPVALFTTRASFVGHDAGHQQIARKAGTHRVLSLLHGNLLMGMSMGWWNAKHNKHHANPNHLDKDPDVGVGVLVWDEGQTAGRTGFM